MTMTNYGNKYKFKAIMDKYHRKDTVMVQRMKNDGTWGKATEIQRFSGETDEQVVERMVKNNNRQFKLAR